MSNYGFFKVPREVGKAISNVNAPTPQQVVPFPHSPPSNFVLDFATEELSTEVLNHSMRVYQYSVAIIKDQFPNWHLDDDVLFAACMLHDIGTTDKNIAATKMSFEYYGGLLSRELILQATGGNHDFAEAVSEAIIRHQDLADSGFITALGFILQVSTTLDNIGSNSNLIHFETVDLINKRFSRENWSTCFAHVIGEENNKKPWCHTSALGDDFKKNVLENSLEYTKN
ncbi:hypothetical protein BZL39_I05810 [Zygosaccharomyces parabailii]|nr:hypothetical protein BZL39_I05810 [Zygosaccharomyces parabailii]CDH16895.1 probable DNA damage-inducible protein 3 [Zygosaccharomyces bailii ISA1307]